MTTKEKLLDRIFEIESKAKRANKSGRELEKLAMKYEPATIYSQSGYDWLSVVGGCSSIVDCCNIMRYIISSSPVFDFDEDFFDED